MTNTPIVTEDEVWIYYSAITTTHGGYIRKKQISAARGAKPHRVYAPFRDVRISSSA